MVRPHLLRQPRVVAFALVLTIFVLGVAAAPALADATSLPAPASAPTWSPNWVADPVGTFDNGTCIARDPASGAIYAAGMADGTQIVTVAYDAAGVKQWTKTYAGTNPAAIDGAGAVGIAVDYHGNVIVLGNLPNTATNMDWTVLKYGSDGTLLWHKTITGSGRLGNDRAAALIIGAKGGIFAAGQLGVRFHRSDAALVRLTSAGKVAWKRFIDGPAHRSDAFTAMAQDAAGRLYGGGQVARANDSTDCLLACFSSSGKRLWARTWGGSAGGSDDVADLAVTAQGKAYAVGEFAIKGGTKAMIRQYGPTGRFVWQATFRTSKPGFDRFDAVTLAPGGRVAAVSTFTNATTGNANIVTIAFRAAGPALWEKTWDTPSLPGDPKSQDVASDILADPQGRIYVVGKTGDNADGDADFAVLSYGSTGALRWGGPRLWDGAHGDDAAAAGLLTPTGIAVTGFAAVVPPPGYSDARSLETVEFPY